MLVTTTRGARGHEDAALPLLVVLPWSHSTPAELLAEVGYVEIDVPARVIAIQGFEPDRGGYSFWVRTRPVPTDPDDDDEWLALVTARAARLAALLERLRAHFHAREPPVVSGVSQGADLSLVLALRHPGSITAALPIAARAPASIWPAPTAHVSSPGQPDGDSAGARRTGGHSGKAAIDAFQGTADEAAPFAAFARATEALRARGVPLVLHAYPGVKHEVSPAMRRDILACAAARLRESRSTSGCPAAS